MQDENKTLIPSKFRNYLVMYSDILVRSLIAFTFSFVVFSIIGFGILHISFVIILILAFCFGVLITPFLSRINLGNRFVNWYEKILQRIIDRIDRFIKGKGEYK